MVYHGPSKGCRACRKRRVKCDQGKPACNNCIRRKVECPGYESTFDYRHRNETKSTILRVQQKGDLTRRKDVSEPNDTAPSDQVAEIHLDDGSDPFPEPSSNDMTVMLADVPPPPKFDYHFDSLRPDPESIVLNWYFTNYPMKCIDPQSSHGFVALLKPMYLASSLDSPLRPAVAAIASNLMMLFSHQGSDTDMARNFYAKSVSRMKNKITDPEKSKQDDMIVTTMTLNWYDMINLRYSHDPTNFNNHRDGALALFKHRGSSNHNSEVSRHITASIRTAFCRWALDSETEIAPDVLQWLTENSVPTNKACELDIVTLKLIEYQLRFKRFYRLHKMGQFFQATEASVRTMIEAGLEVDKAFQEWGDSCANHWYPLHTPAKDALPSIRKAGFYGDRCAVYWDLSICDSWNTFRQRRVMLLRMVRQLCIDKNEPQFISTLASLEATIQQLLDEQCESIPFMLGDVSTAMQHGKLYDICYPSASDGIWTFPNPDHDHPRAAASSGGWLGAGLLASVAKLAVKEGNLDTFTMRPGQFEWILGQLGRFHTVFLLSQPARQSSWKRYTKF